MPGHKKPAAPTAPKSRTPRIRDTDAARIVIDTGDSFRTVGRVYAGNPDVRPSVRARVDASARRNGIPAPPSAALVLTTNKSRKTRSALRGGASFGCNGDRP